MKPVTAAQIDALLPFPERFEETGFSAGTENPPWFTYNDAVSEFMQVLYAKDWIKPEFDWMEWDGVDDYVTCPAAMASADLETIQKLLTSHARTDHFCEGHLVSLFDNGHIVALLRRLQVIRTALPETPDR